MLPSMLNMHCLCILSSFFLFLELTFQNLLKYTLPSVYICTSVPKSFWFCLLQYDPQASGVIDYQALMKELLHSDYYALYLGSVDNTQNTLDATSTYNMITNLKTQFAAQGHKLQQVSIKLLLPDVFLHLRVVWEPCACAL